MKAPLDGDTAHRQGFALTENPFPHDPCHPEFREKWESDWRFRHMHAPDTAADGVYGSRRPNETKSARRKL